MSVRPYVPCALCLRPYVLRSYVLRSFVCTLMSYIATTYGAGFTLSHKMLNTKQENCKYQFLVFGLTRPGIEPESIGTQC